MFSISEVSKKIKVHSQTLRNWERHGLVCPKRIGNVRVFSEVDLKRCEDIKRYSRRGVSRQRLQAMLALHPEVLKEKTETGGRL